MATGMRSIHVASSSSITLLVLLLSLLAAATATGEDLLWPASSDPMTLPSQAGPERTGFSLHIEGETARISMVLNGETIERQLPAANLPAGFPFAGRARLGIPFGRYAPPAPMHPYTSQGWYLWNDRPAPILASGPGTLVSNEIRAGFGRIVEIDHGEGLRSRYLMFRQGESAATPGESVEEGAMIGELGPGQVDDVPFIRFEILVDRGDGAFVTLDPAPFLFRSHGATASPLGTNLLNAAVRADDGPELSRLLSLGIDPNRAASDDTIPLEWAVMDRDVAMTRILIAAGADPSLATAPNSGKPIEGWERTIANTGPTIFEYAAQSGDAELEAALRGK